MVAMGGNSLSPTGETGTITQQFSHTREALDGIGNFIERGYNLCINHGNGPQVGNELLRMDLTHEKFILSLWAFVLLELKVRLAI